MVFVAIFMREMGFSSASTKDYHITHNTSWVLKLVVEVLRTFFHTSWVLKLVVEVLRTFFHTSWVLKLVVAVLRTFFQSVVVITDSAPRATFHYTLLHLNITSQL
jgi:hypothetical protein